ncbi:vancomycin high temperature exclusion protein [Roseivirga sp. BDSF3-8]|uniref:SanA/YdcF family protein n=1 Tax=Roseivirga sp. BDSF3-8 TaxID=3241598 RepID=UPI0035320A13
MRVLKFIGWLILWLTLSASVMVFLYYQDAEVFLHDLAEGKDQTIRLAKGTTQYFEHADSWNLLNVTVIMSSILLMFAANDLYIRRKFGSKKEKKKKKPTSKGDAYKTGIWFLRLSGATILVLVEVVLLCNIWIVGWSLPDTYTDASDVPEKSAVLLLGTNKKLRSTGGENLYYTYRINAVKELYQAGKVSSIIISGDNGRDTYNEPRDMKYDLIRAGIPEGLIKLDFAGFRTLDSVVRLKLHFKKEKAIIVSQRFHTERALFLCRQFDVQARAYPADGLPTMNMVLRELVAKPKAMLDVFVFNMQPKYGRIPDRKPLDLNQKEDQLKLTYAALLFIAALVIAARSLKNY